MSSVTLSTSTDRGDCPPRLVTFAGATGRVLTITISGTDLTDDTVTLSARQGGASGTVVLDAVSLTVVTPASGVCTWQDTTGLLDEAQELDAQVSFGTGASDTDYTEQFKLVVLPAIVGS